MFDLQPTLDGDLVRLRPLRQEDFEDLYAVASDPLIWEQHPVKDRYKREVFEGLFRESLASGGTLVAIDAHDDAVNDVDVADSRVKDGRIIGWSRFHRYDEARSEIEIGYTFLAKSYWGGVYNREMKHLMLRHAFRFVDSVVFLVGPQNLRSQKAMEKIGGVQAGLRIDAGGRESIVYLITRDSFEQHRAAARDLVSRPGAPLIRER